ncbi:MAG: DUF2892 domain-containing protein [Bdellovibrionaceae bacterium]|nr:DUF2892 domain-containing protein [Pseudobdellovibrionaceae bacterium]
MTIENQIRAFAGTMVLSSVALTYYHSPLWVWFTVFVGVNLLQSSVTKFCLVEKVFRKLQNK